jgi:hypothetical protein
MPRQCFLRSQFPGYIARAVQKATSLQSWSLSLELAVTRIVLARDAIREVPVVAVFGEEPAK